MIEEYLEGDEISVLAFSDGYTIVPLPPAQDHKRIFDGDTGPNTGGMGCYAPAPVATPEILREIQKTVLQPTIHGMRKDGEINSSSRAHRRVSFCWMSIHRLYVDQGRSKSARIQCTLRGSRDADDHPSTRGRY